MNDKKKLEDDTNIHPDLHDDLTTRHGGDDTIAADTFIPAGEFKGGGTSLPYIAGEPVAGFIRSQEGRGGRPVTEPSPYSPLKYDAAKHRKRLQRKLQTMVLDIAESDPEAVVDNTFAAVEELQMELVRESVASGLGLEAFFPAEQRRSIQISKPVRLRIEQVILMLGDAFVKRCEDGSKKPETSDTPIFDLPEGPYKKALEAYGEYRELDNSQGALCMLAEAFGMGDEDHALVGMRDGEWDLSETWKWAQSLCLSEKYVIQFCLSVWNSSAEWAPFDIVAAVNVWDRDRRAALKGWLDMPWWP